MSVLGLACWSCIELVSLTQILEQRFVQSAGSADSGGCGVGAFEKLQEFVARTTKEVANHPGNHRISYVGKLHARFVVMGFRAKAAIEKTLEMKAVQYCHYRRVSENAFGVDSELNVPHGDRIAPPHRLHDVELERSECERVIPGLSCLFDLQEAPTSRDRPPYLGRARESNGRGMSRDGGAGAH